MHSEWWLGTGPDERFAPLMDADLHSRAGYRHEVVPYLRARGVSADSTIEQLTRLDLLNLAHGLTILFCADHETILESVMPDHLYQVIHDVQPVIDHVGRELFGPLDFHLEVLADLCPRSGLDHVALAPGASITSEGNAVFQSVQVVEALRQFDPDLAGVTIAKIHFAEHDQPSSTGCLELFQAAARDGSAPQGYHHTIERMNNLHLAAGQVGAGLSLQPPICHISVEAPDVETVLAVHEVVRTDTSGLLMPYVDRVTENPGDRSTNTKLSVRGNTSSPMYNQIIEVVHHRP